MKKLMFTLVAMLTMAAGARAMSYEQARNEALFLTDKMAYELNLTDAQYEAAFEINLDYLMCVSNNTDVFGVYWERRNMDLNYILYSWQWDAFRAATYFYRPLYWEAGLWHFRIYINYPRRDYFYFGTPHFYLTYRGGHSWHMNNGRSYYERRRHDYRDRHWSSNNHRGMRDGWDRGDYRHGSGSQASSTRTTVGNRPSENHNNGSRSNQGNIGSGRRDRQTTSGYNPNGRQYNNNGGNTGNATGGYRNAGSGTRSQNATTSQSNGSGTRSYNNGSSSFNRSTGTFNRGNNTAGYNANRQQSTATRSTTVTRSAGQMSRPSSSASSATRSAGSASAGGGHRGGGRR